MWNVYRGVEVREVRCGYEFTALQGHGNKSEEQIF